MKKSYNIVFMGGKQAGLIGLLTILAAGHKVEAVIAYDYIIDKTASFLDIPFFSSIHNKDVYRFLSDCDILVSVHGREIITDAELALPRLGGINVHPCLYKYKGTRPVERMLADKIRLASVGIHKMTSEVDCGEVIVEHFLHIGDAKTPEEVYNRLYPLYSRTLLEALDEIE